MDYSTDTAVRKHLTPGTRGPDDLEDFCSKVVEEMSEGRHTADPPEPAPEPDRNS